MPLVTTTEMFKKAYDGGYAIGAFNVNNMEIVQGITEAAKEPDTFSNSILSIASDYIEGFNKIDNGLHFIETEEREDIYNAFESLLDEMKMSVNRDSLHSLMDEKRKW